MTDITELAQSLKAAAGKLDGAHWQTRKGFSGIEVIVKGSLEKRSGFTSFQPVAADLADSKTAKAIALFSPANIRALVEALEKAQAVMSAVVTAAAIRGVRPFDGIDCDPPTLEENAEACGDAMSARIRELEANPPKPHHNGLMQISNELASAKQRIAELEPISAAAEKLVRCKGRYYSEQNYRALAALFGVTTPDLPPLGGESRTVTVKLPRPGFVTISGERMAVYLKADVDAALDAAGIREDE